MTAALRVVAVVLVLGLLGGGLAFGLSLLYDAGVPITVCLVGGVLICGGGWALSGQSTEDVGELAPRSEPGREQRSSFGDLHTVQARFAAAIGDTDRFEDRVRRPLAQLTAERLRQRHHIDWLDQPDRARAILDPQLWQLLTAPGGRCAPTVEQTRIWVSAIERL